MTEAPLPSHASVVVIGGGIMGCSTLYHLAAAGVGDAVLLERNKLTSGTTWHSAAQVRALRSSKNLTDLIRYSISLYAKLEEETGQATGWINKGSLSIATNEDRMIHIRRQVDLARLYGVRAQTVSAAEAGERWPLMNTEDVVGAVWSPDDGRVSPSDLCAALVKGARARGASLFEDTGVEAILTRNGKVAGLETSRGRIDCDAVALCTGLWSREVAATAGASVPVWPCEHYYLLTQPVEGISGNLPTLSDHDGHLYIRDDSGGLLVGCFEPNAIAIDPERIGSSFEFQLLPEDWDHFEPMMLNALHRLPALETAGVRMLLNGPESFTPDGSFLLGETAETSGLFLGCGMNSVGVATGGGAGMALAHCIVNGRTPTDLQEADPKRFPDVFNDVAALSERVPEVLGKHYEIAYPGRQMDTSRNLRLSPLHDQWKAANAWFGQAYGWERPMYFDAARPPAPTFGRPAWFEQVGAEVRQAHERAAVFDLSSFGLIDVSGPDARDFLERMCANRMDRPAGRVVYTTMLNETGGIESDLTAMVLADDHYRLTVGTAAIRRDLAWLKRHGDGLNIEISDCTEDYATLGLMGPEAAAIVESLGGGEVLDLAFFRFVETTLGGVPVRAARLSYVGEPGWEITCRNEDAGRLYRQLHHAGARPAGTLAQTSMRIEKRFLSYGHDMDADMTPLDAGLAFAVAWDTPFLGREALLAQRENGSENRLASLVFDDVTANPLGHEPVLVGGEIVARTTSAAFGFRVGRPVAIVDFRRSADIVEGQSVTVDIAGSPYSARVVTGPAYVPG